MQHVLAWGLPMGAEWIVIGALGLLIFGKRLPEVGKGIGSAIKNFKLGMKETGDEEVPPADEKAVVKAPDEKAYKFDPHTGKPL
jgi:TatA/E family protein of Tat protein translocase